MLWKFDVSPQIKEFELNNNPVIVTVNKFDEESAIEFRNRVNEINNRDGAQLTDEHKATMQTYLQTLKADNIDALISGDKDAQEEAMNILNNASNATTGWGIAIDEIKNVTQGTDGSGGVGFSNAMDSKTADILGKIASGESTMKVDEEGKVTFDVVVGGETLNITNTAVRNINVIGLIFLLNQLPCFKSASQRADT